MIFIVVLKPVCMFKKIKKKSTNNVGGS